jgi:hypothetical protein
MRLVGSPQAHRTGLAALLYCLVLSHQRPSEIVTEVNTPGAMTSRSIFDNQSSTWFSHDEYVGV